MREEDNFSLSEMVKENVTVDQLDCLALDNFRPWLSATDAIVDGLVVICPTALQMKKSYSFILTYQLIHEPIAGS